MENGRGDRYAYDPEGQLQTASYQAQNPEGAASAPQREDNFAPYDALGNRPGWNLVASRGWMNFARRNNGLNQYLSWENMYPNPPQHWGSAIYYDDNFQYPTPPWVWPGNGVTMADGYITASYNALNQPVAMWSFAYSGTPNLMFFEFDPLGRCVKRWVGASGDSTTPFATFLYYDGWNLIQEGTGASASSTQRLYVHGGCVDEIVKSINYGSGQSAFHHYDARGHCTLLTNTSGLILEQYDYDAFGWPYFYAAGGLPMTVNGQPGSAFGNRFLFTGREWIKDVRLYDYRNRMYQPELGRFLQPDPKEFAAGDYNLYRYCHNDPINKNDPFGLEEFKLKIVLPEETGSHLRRVVEATFQGYRSAVLAGKGGGKNAADSGSRVEMHGRMASVDSAPGWYVHGPAVRGTISKDHTMNESDIKGEAAGPIPIGTHDAGMYWVLAQHQDPYSWPVNKKSGLSDGQVLRNAHRTGVLTNPPPKGGGQFTYHWYDAETNKEGY
jgi:RHS repeat-associated protein